MYYLQMGFLRSSDYPTYLCSTTVRSGEGRIRGILLYLITSYVGNVVRECGCDVSDFNSARPGQMTPLVRPAAPSSHVMCCGSIVAAPSADYCVPQEPRTLDQSGAGNLEARMHHRRHEATLCSCINSFLSSDNRNIYSYSTLSPPDANLI